RMFQRAPVSSTTNTSTRPSAVRPAAAGPTTKRPDGALCGSQLDQLLLLLQAVCSRRQSWPFATNTSSRPSAFGATPGPEKPCAGRGGGAPSAVTGTQPFLHAVCHGCSSPAPPAKKNSSRPSPLDASVAGHDPPVPTAVHPDQLLLLLHPVCPMCHSAPSRVK